MSAQPDSRKRTNHNHRGLESVQSASMTIISAKRIALVHVERAERSVAIVSTVCSQSLNILRVARLVEMSPLACGNPHTLRHRSINDETHSDCMFPGRIQ